MGQSLFQGSMIQVNRLIRQLLALKLLSTQKATLVDPPETSHLEATTFNYLQVPQNNKNVD